MNEPLKKVTEIVGSHLVGPEWDELIGDGIWDSCSMGDILPDAAFAGIQEGAGELKGPRGRFRITVEFWPDEAEERGSESRGAA